MQKLDRRKLIAEGQKLIENEQIGTVAEIQIPIQEIKKWDDVYELKLVLTLKECKK